MPNRVIVILVLVLVAALAGGALAASPKKGGVYEGALFETSVGALQKKVRLVVAKSGTSARVIWWCGTGRAPSTMRFPIAADGTFKASNNAGTLTVWAIKGRFVSPSKARVALQLKAICDGRGGTVNLALQP
ncbi:MAG: hypothetical protein H0U46_07535 [Actinobacteria bacterium]|nr:hypothetical protein [Actinomycetota bacterium]